MKYEEHYSVTSHDIDVNNNLRPSPAVRYLEETADHQLRDRKPTYRELFAAGQSYIVIRLIAKINEQIHEYDDITGKTWVCDPKGATIIRCFSLEKDGRTMIDAYSEWALVDFKNGGFVKPADTDFSNYEADEPTELALPKRFNLKKKDGFEHVGTHRVVYSEVDMNVHMNNTVYFDMLWDYIPEIYHKEVTSLNIRFRKEASLGADIEIYMKQLDTEAAHDEDAEEVWGFITETGGKVNSEIMFGVRKAEKLGMHR